jgi:hypothetical protein
MTPEERAFILQLSERLTRVQVRLMAIQSLLQQGGMSQQEIDARVNDLQNRWDKKYGSSLASAIETLKQEDLLRLLDNFEGTEQ